MQSHFCEMMFTELKELSDQLTRLDDQYRDAVRQCGREKRSIELISELLELDGQSINPKIAAGVADAKAQIDQAQI